MERAALIDWEGRRRAQTFKIIRQLDMRAALVMLVALFGGVAAGFAAGCSESTLGLLPHETQAAADAGPDGAGGAGGTGGAGMAGAAPEGPQARVIQLSPWPGRGLQIAIERSASDNSGELPPVWVEGPLGDVIPAVAAIPKPQPGITAVLVVPAEDAALHAQRLATAAALIDALPAGESIVLLSARDMPVLMADRSADRSHAAKRLMEIQPEAGFTAAAVLEQVRAQLAECGGEEGPLYRSLVVVGEAAADNPALAVDPVQTFSIAQTGDPASEAAALVSEQAARRAAIVRIGVCAGLKKDAPFALHAGETHTELSAPAPWDHLLNVVCSADEASRDDYPYPDEIQLTFTPDERAIFDQYYASNSEEVFRTSITLGEGSMIGADVHLHGNSSLGCQRKSLSVHLDGKDRRLMPGAAEDQFFLLSMCLDERYFGQVWGARLMSKWGVYTQRVRYVRLRIDGENRGVYLMVQRPEDTVRTDEMGVVSVIRRRYDIQGEPAEAKYPSDPAAAAQAISVYDELANIATTEVPANIAPALDTRLDLDAYLRWLAFNSVLHNGDYIDEAFFYASAENGQSFHRAMGWDLDDLFESCHDGGFNAIADPCGLTYCAEAQLDQALIRSPEVYQRYLKALEWALSVLTPAELGTMMGDVRDDLWKLVNDDETSAALVEMVNQNPAAVTAVEARKDIQAHMNTMVSAAKSRHTLLMSGLAACSP